MTELVFSFLAFSPFFYTWRFCQYSKWHHELYWRGSAVTLGEELCQNYRTPTPSSYDIELIWLCAHSRSVMSWASPPFCAHQMWGRESHMLIGSEMTANFWAWTEPKNELKLITNNDQKKKSRQWKSQYSLTLMVSGKVHSTRMVIGEGSFLHWWSVEK